MPEFCPRVLSLLPMLSLLTISAAADEPLSAVWDVPAGEPAALRANFYESLLLVK